MRISIRSLIGFRLAAAAVWLCCSGAAWAGDGGDLASLNQLLSTSTTGLCAILKLTTCYQLPTITQGILEVAALGNSPPEMVAAQNAIAPGSNVIAGNAAAVPPGGLGVPFPLNSNSSPTLSELLSTLTPIAFVSAQNANGSATPTQPYNPNADASLYAVGVSSQAATNFGGGNLTNPDTMYFFYDDTSRTNANLKQGQIVAKFSLPLTVLSSDGVTETTYPTTLQFTVPATGKPPCSASTVTSTLWPNGIAAAQIGLNCAVVFSPSPTSPGSHAIFEVAVPLLVTGLCAADPSLCLSTDPTPPPNTDPPYFYFAITGDAGNGIPTPNKMPPPKFLPPTTGNFGTYTAFGASGDDLGTVPPSGILPTGAFSIGLAPTATPLCTSTTCPLPLGTLPPAGSLSFSLCANLPVGNGNGQAPVPAVAAFYAIATDGETLLGAPLAPIVPIVCPAL